MRLVCEIAALHIFTVLVISTICCSTKTRSRLLFALSLLRGGSWFGRRPSAALWCETLAHFRHPAARLALVTLIESPLAAHPRGPRLPLAAMGIISNDGYSLNHLE